VRKVFYINENFSDGPSNPKVQAIKLIGAKLSGINDLERVRNRQQTLRLLLWPKY